MDVTPEKDLLTRLIAAHRPVAVPDPFAYEGSGQVMVHCRACDGARLYLRRPEDEPYRCTFWREALDLGLVTEEGT